MEIDLRAEDAKTSQIAQERLKFFDVLIPPGLSELDAKRTIGIENSAVDLDAKTSETLLRSADGLIRRVVADLGMYPAQSDLLQEQQLFIARAGEVEHCGDLGIVGVVLLLAWCGGHRWSGRERRHSAGKREFQKATACDLSKIVGSHDLLTNTVSALPASAAACWP